MAVAINATITFEHIASHLEGITSTHIGMVHAVFVGSKKIYKVQSSIDTTKEYTVYRSKSRGYQCNCPSGTHGWWNVTHPSGVCWHVRAAVACALEERKALAEQEQLNTLKQAAGVSYTDVDCATLKRIAERNKKQTPVVTVAPTRQAGFSLLKRA